MAPLMNQSPRAVRMVSCAVGACVALGTAGCEHQGRHGTGISAGAAPTIVCGTTLRGRGGSGAVLDDASRSDAIRVTVASAPNWVYLRLSTNCAKGDRVSIRPSSAGTVMRVARADDGLVAGVAIRPNTARPFVVLGKGSHDVAVTIDLGTQGS